MIRRIDALIAAGVELKKLEAVDWARYGLTSTQKSRSGIDGTTTHICFCADETKRIYISIHSFLNSVGSLSEPSRSGVTQ